MNGLMRLRMTFSESHAGAYYMEHPAITRKAFRSFRQTELPGYSLNRFGVV